MRADRGAVGHLLVGDRREKTRENATWLLLLCSVLYIGSLRSGFDNRTSLVCTVLSLPCSVLCLCLVVYCVFVLCLCLAVYCVFVLQCIVYWHLALLSIVGKRRY